jgi:hypothetical protein
MSKPRTGGAPPVASKYLVIAGCHKSGTTSLYTYLSWHPAISASPTKETNFFLEHPEGTARDYERMFVVTPGKDIFMEASPDYFYGGSVVAARLKKALPKLHVVILIRNPVDKVFEQFNHNKKAMYVDRAWSFDDYMKDIPLDEVNEAYRKGERYKEERGKRPEDATEPSLAEARKKLLVCGFLYEDLFQWTEVFAKEELSIVWFDDFARDPRAILRKLSTNVGFDPTFYDRAKFPIENASWIYRNATLHRAGRRFFKSYEPFFRRHYSVKRRLRSAYFALNGISIKDQMSLDTRRRLQDVYREDLGKLQKLLRDIGYASLPDWLS